MVSRARFCRRVDDNTNRAIDRAFERRKNARTENPCSEAKEEGSLCHSRDEESRLADLTTITHGFNHNRDPLLPTRTAPRSDRSIGPIGPIDRDATPIHFYRSRLVRIDLKIFPRERTNERFTNANEKIEKN